MEKLPPKKKRLPPGVKHLPKGISWQVPPGRRRPAYLVRIRYGRKQMSLGRYESLGDAKAALADAQRRIKDGVFIPPAEIRRRALLEQEEQDRIRVTVAEYAETWLQDLAEDIDAPRSPATIAAYRSTLNKHIIPALGERLMIDVSQTAVDNLRRKVEKESGPGAARNVALALRSMYGHAVENEAAGLTERPFKIKLKKAEKIDAAKVPTPAEVTRISLQMPPELALAPLLSAVCALRAGELLGLQRGDLDGLDTEAPVLHVRRQWNTKTNPPSYTDPKVGSSRTVTIPRFLVPQIQNHLDTYVAPDDDAPVFVSSRSTKKPISANTYRTRWDRAVEAAGVSKYVLHSLRHLGLSLLSIVGATQAEVMARGGHRDLEAAARYQHELDGRALELAAALGDKWEGK